MSAEFPALEQMFNLQRQQVRHDEIYHKEIAQRSTARRLTHVTLHLAKYVGDLHLARVSGDSPALRAKIVDSLIIVLSGAGALDHLLQRTVLSTKVSTVDDAVRASKAYGRLSASNWLFQMAIEVGRMAKACEAWDHLETFPARETLQTCLNELLVVLLFAAHTESIPWIDAISTRLKAVRDKRTFNLTLFHEKTSISA